MIERIREWWLNLTCQHQRQIGRLRWVEEVVDYYSECADCGREFFE